MQQEMGDLRKELAEQRKHGKHCPLGPSSSLCILHVPATPYLLSIQQQIDAGSTSLGGNFSPTVAPTPSLSINVVAWMKRVMWPA